MRFETALSATGFPDGGDYGNSFVKISPSGGMLSVSDYFTMSGEIAESTDDVDLGSGGVMLLPDMTDASGTQVRQLAVGAGKDSNLYVVDRNNMGKFTSVGNNIWQQLSGVLSGGVWATPAYFNLGIYYGRLGWPTDGIFGDRRAALELSDVAECHAVHFPWNLPDNLGEWDGKRDRLGVREHVARRAPRLRGDQSLLRSCTTAIRERPTGRDQFGAGSKNVAPVVVDGKVFVATTNSVAVFGLLP